MKLTDYLLTVGKKIRGARIQAGLRQIDIQEKCGLSYRHYQNIEAGRINLTIGTLRKLARTFEVSIHELIENG